MTSTLTDCVVRNISMQANAKITDEVVKEQTEKIDNLKLMNSSMYSSSDAFVTTESRLFFLKIFSNSSNETSSPSTLRTTADGTAAAFCMGCAFALNQAVQVSKTLKSRTFVKRIWVELNMIIYNCNLVLLL
jgi:hypothetical protein